MFKIEMMKLEMKQQFLLKEKELDEELNFIEEKGDTFHRKEEKELSFHMNTGQRNQDTYECVDTKGVPYQKESFVQH